MPRTETVIFALGESSLETARKVSMALDAPIVFRGFSLLKPDPGKSDVGSQLREHFQAGRAVVGVCAAGILIRSLAQVLRSKLSEPPVICVADDGSAVVPLLGGHRGPIRSRSRLPTLWVAKLPSRPRAMPFWGWPWTTRPQVGASKILGT